MSANFNNNFMTTSFGRTLKSGTIHSTIQTTTDGRHQKYLKDMLVNQFMTKHNVFDRVVSPDRREVDRRQKAV